MPTCLQLLHADLLATPFVEKPRAHPNHPLSHNGQAHMRVIVYTSLVMARHKEHLEVSTSSLQLSERMEHACAAGCVQTECISQR
eukprot:6172004-Pleurochrysis_carterae.AAC.2